VISSPSEAVEASKCALDRMTKDSSSKCALAAVGCRWCATSVKPLLREIRNYLEDPKNESAIASHSVGRLI